MTATRIPSWCARLQHCPCWSSAVTDVCIGAVQVQRARECETNTGTAEAPQSAGAEACFMLADRHDRLRLHAMLHESCMQEDDPLEAFMAEINQETKAEPASVKPQKASLELDEEDNMTSFIEVSGCSWRY